MTREKYIGEYLEKKMKNVKLPYGMQWFNVLAENTTKAEKSWERKQKAIKKKI